MGLAVTDSPASLGTEKIQLTLNKQHFLKSDYIAFPPIESEVCPDEKTSRFNGSSGEREPMPCENRFLDHLDRAFSRLAERAGVADSATQDLATQQARLDKLEGEIKELKVSLEKPSHYQPDRPIATGESQRSDYVAEY